jgi:hypothetical protein
VPRYKVAVDGHESPLTAPECERSQTGFRLRDYVVGVWRQREQRAHRNIFSTRFLQAMRDHAFGLRRPAPDLWLSLRTSSGAVCTAVGSVAAPVNQSTRRWRASVQCTEDHENRPRRPRSHQPTLMVSTAAGARPYRLARVGDEGRRDDTQRQHATGEPTALFGRARTPLPVLDRPVSCPLPAAIRG